MNGHTFTYSGNDVYSLCGFVGNSGTMTINGSGGTIVSDEVGLNSIEGVLNVNDATIKANSIGIYNKGQNLKRQYLNLKISRLKIVEQTLNLVVMVPLIFQNIMEMLLQLILIMK